MTLSIAALQELSAEHDELTHVDDMSDLGLLPCMWTCWITCLHTCGVTEF